MNYAVLELPQLSDTGLNYEDKLTPFLRHPLFGWMGMRPALAQHTADEHAALRRLAAGRSSIVEIGVAEGVSAAAIREVMSADGILYLIDPFHLSRVPSLNFTKRVAHRSVGSCSRGQAIWIEKFSFDAARTWNVPIDFLFIDGDHSGRGIQRDWDDWSRFVASGGLVVFHDARLFEGGWTNPAYGPVKLVDRLFRNTKNQGWMIVQEVHSLVVVERNR